MLNKLSLMGLCLSLLAVATVPLATPISPAHAQGLTNDSVGGVNLAQMRAEFEGRFKEDRVCQLKILRRLAEQGYGPAQYQMGVAYDSGYGELAKNKSTADEWYRKAAQTLPQQAEAGDDEAQRSLGVMYFYGRGGLAKNEATVCSWLRKSADQGNRVAQRTLDNAC